MIETARLIVRPWRDSDRAPFAAMGRDPEVMAALGPPKTPEQADAAVDRQQAFQTVHGYCFWALELRGAGEFLGFCGLKPGAQDTPIEAEIEIGWRLARAHWGKGYAREAAQAAIAWGFANLPAPRIMAITTPGNVRSWGLMERLGMARRHDLDFDHPALPPGDPLRPHITYEVARA